MYSIFAQSLKVACRQDLHRFADEHPQKPIHEADRRREDAAQTRRKRMFRRGWFS